MIDLHAHLLPGVDDGPDTLNEALAMIAVARDDGVHDVLVTPHQRHENWPGASRSVLSEVFATLRATAGEHGPRLHLGAELRVDSELLAEVDALPGGELLTLAGSRYLLLEFPSLGGGPEPRAVVHELAVAGWRPVIAHPERIPWLAEDGELLAALAGLGALFQVTAMSVVGRFGKRAEACCHFLLDEGLLHFVASDAHDPERRQPRLSGAFRAVETRLGPDTARRLFVDNPRAVLEDRPLSPLS